MRAVIFASRLPSSTSPRSALSRALARLEADLGVRLFRRTTRSVFLTDEGEAFLSEIHGAVGTIDRLNRFRWTPRGTLHISTSEGMALQFTPPTRNVPRHRCRRQVRRYRSGGFRRIISGQSSSRYLCSVTSAYLSGLSKVPTLTWNIEENPSAYSCSLRRPFPSLSSSPHVFWTSDALA